MTELIRINKRMAELGLCSRREADTLINEGSVFVNGAKAVMGQKVSPTDEITLKGQSGKKKQYLAYYKGRGVITHSPAAHETDIAMKIKADYSITDLYPVGRLDKDSEGLIILTNDGRITGPLTDSEAGHEKTYEILVDKPTTPGFATQMEKGVNIEGYTTKPAKLERNRRNPKRFTLTITEGKKHQIRRMCVALGYQVQSLKRIQIVNVTIGDLKPNQYRHIKGAELAALLKTLGVSK